MAIAVLLIPGIFGLAAGAPTTIAVGAGGPVVGGNTTWTNLTANLSYSPPQMIGPQMTFDPQVRGVVMFGGYPSTAHTYIFGASGWRVGSLGGRVSTTNLAGFAYDAAAGTAVLFGGNGYTINSGAAFNFTHGHWAKMNTSVLPPGRSSPSMAYDAASGKIVLFGGCGPPNTAGTCLPYGDTWTFANDTWTKLNLSVTPSSRMGAAMSYDPVLRAVVLFGGCVSVLSNVCQAISNETWEFRAGTWTNLTTAVAPPPRYLSEMVENPGPSHVRPSGVVLFAGTQLNGTLLGDTWALHGTRWVQLHPLASPSPRVSFSLSYDPLLSEIVLFSGYSGGAYFTNDTWVLA
jgi:hypothetical protein